MLVVVALVVVLVGSSCRASAPRAESSPGASISSSLPGPSAEPPTDQPTVTGQTPVGPRTEDLVVSSSAVGRDVHALVLLPAGFAAEPSRHWPVLYLLHGCCDTYLSWSLSTDIAKLSARLPALVVMPEGGAVGFYSDWREGPGWETFHTRELPAALRATYRADGPSAIAGLSMGGLGALGYAARHPHQYTAAASFSGIVDTRLSAGESAAYVDLVESEDQDASKLWGDPVSDASTWREHNPYDLADRLRGTRLFISCGNGQPGPLDPKGAAPDADEAALLAENQALVRRLRQLDVPATVDLYGRGTHTWPYWQRELHAAWPLLTADLS